LNVDQNELSGKLTAIGWRLVHFPREGTTGRFRAAHDGARSDQSASSAEDLVRRCESWNADTRAAA
jgi:hypothetical protein